MAVTTAPQPPYTYLLWKRFSMPIDQTTRDAIAVPNQVANQLGSAYTILVTSMVLSLWAILSALGFLLRFRRRREVTSVSTIIWNRKATLRDTLIGVILTADEHWRQWWWYLVAIAVAACWVAQIAISVTIPAYIFIGNAAPVNPSAIFAPRMMTGPIDTSRASTLDALPIARAISTAQFMPVSLLPRLSIQSTIQGSRSDGELIQTIEYKYDVKGTDLGLQHFPDLGLSVTGACITEYGWLLSSSDGSGYTNDTYARFGDRRYGTVSLSLFDGATPTPYFYNGPKPAGEQPGNMTWAMFVSSVDRLSFTPSTDPFYSTMASSLNPGSYAVKPRRPALSCWQRDLWSYKGHNSTIIGLNSTALPGLTMPPGLQLILARYFGTPRIVSTGRALGNSALLSNGTAVGNIFDAESVSITHDIERLIKATYISAVNVLTDTTLYTNHNGLGNLAVDIDNGQPRPGVAEFVVWSPDVTTLSVKVIIIIPVLAAAMWLLAFVLLRWTPLRIASSLDAVVLLKTLMGKYPSAVPLEDNAWYIESASSHSVAIPGAESKHC